MAAEPDVKSEISKIQYPNCKFELSPDCPIRNRKKLGMDQAFCGLTNQQKCWSEPAQSVGYSPMVRTTFLILWSHWTTLLHFTVSNQKKVVPISFVVRTTLAGLNQIFYVGTRKSGINHPSGSMNHTAGPHHFFLVQTTIAGLNQPKAVRTSGLDQTMMGCGTSQ